MSVKVIINPNLDQELKGVAQFALSRTADALHTEIVQAQVVPRDTGVLQNEAFFLDLTNIGNLEANLVHSTPYARRLYFHPEYNFRHDKNPNAKGMWFEDWMEGGSEYDWLVKAFDKFLRRATK